MSDLLQTAKAKPGATAIIQASLVEQKGVFWKIRMAGRRRLMWVHQDDLQIVNEISLNR